MGLLARYRRPLAVVVLALLAAPLIVQVHQGPRPISELEMRLLSRAPAFPQTWQEWLALPRALSRFLGDQFGFRDQLVRVHGLLRYAIDLPSDTRVIMGRDGWLFLNGDGTIDQVTGRLTRKALIAKMVAHADQLNTRLKARNVRFVVAFPPNNATINRARLPPWATERSAVTEYDLLMKALAERGVAAVDLRPPLLAANGTYPVYRRTDTHWNKLGALIAYNVTVTAVGHPDWVIDPDRVLRGFRPVGGGDLARLLGISRDLPDEDAEIDLAPYRAPPVKVSRINTQTDVEGTLVETGLTGPTVVVLGDSFTQGFWQDYFSLHAGRYVWMHYEQCNYSGEIVESYAPDIVILAPTERQMFCWN
jgi:hypothetical protein